MGVSGRHFIGLLSGGFLVIIAKKGSSKVPQGPSPPLLLTVVVDFVTLLTCCNKSLFVILIHCVTVATVTTPTKTKRKRRRTNKNCFLEFQRLTNGTNPWEKLKRKETKWGLFLFSFLFFYLKIDTLCLWITLVNFRSDFIPNRIVYAIMKECAGIN